MRLRLYLADHFDTLVSGKQLAVGLYPDLVVVMSPSPDAPQPTPEVPYAMDMGLMLTLSGLPVGQSVGELRVLPPGLPDRPVLKSGFVCHAAEAGSAVNVTLQARPLLIPAVGTYSVQVTIGAEVLQDEFEVRIRPADGIPAVMVQPLPPEPAAAPVPAPAPAAATRKRRART